MATKATLAAALASDLDAAAATMASAVSTFTAAYVAAHAADIARGRLGFSELGQSMTEDRLNTINTAAHTMHGTTPLFDGRALEPQILAAADAIVAGLKISNPEAFA